MSHTVLSTYVMTKNNHQKIKVANIHQMTNMYIFIVQQHNCS